MNGLPQHTAQYTPLPSLLASPQPAPDTLPPSWPPGVLATAPWCSERRQPSERRRERPHASLALATHRDCQRSLPLVEEGLHVGRSGAAPVEAFVVADAVTHSSSAHLASSQSCQSPKRSTATITRIYPMEPPAIEAPVANAPAPVTEAPTAEAPATVTTADSPLKLRNPCSQRDVLRAAKEVSRPRIARGFDGLWPHYERQTLRHDGLHGPRSHCGPRPRPRAPRPTPAWFELATARAAARRRPDTPLPSPAARRGPPDTPLPLEGVYPFIVPGQTPKSCSTQ